MVRLSEEEREELEKLRLSLLKKQRLVRILSLVFLAIGICLIVGFGIAAGIDGDSLLGAFDGLVGLFLGLLVIALVLYFYGETLSDSYSRRCQSLIDDKTVALLFPGAVAKKDGALDLRVVMAPGFFSAPDRYSGRDYLASVYDGVPFERAHYKLEEVHHDKNDSHYSTYASGTMYRFELRRRFDGTLRIIENDGIKLNLTDLEAVETEYILFNKKFQILTDNKEMAFLILTPRAMEKIMEAEQSFRGRFHMAFVADQLFIAIDDGLSSAKLDIRSPLGEKEMVELEMVSALPAKFIDFFGLSEGKFSFDEGKAEKEETKNQNSFF